MMRITFGIVSVAVLVVAGCASRSTTTTVAGGAAPAPPAATASTQGAARLTPADLEDRMEKIGPAAASMRTHLMANQLSDASKEARDLAAWFGDVERFWSQNNKADAVTWAQQARQAATDTAAAATAGDGMKALMVSGNMFATCKMCHGAYRETDPAGGFRIKAGVL
jgi:hypothetical protein